MGQKKENNLYFVLPTKEGEVIGISLTQNEREMVNRWAEENPDKFEAGAEGVIKAMTELRNEGSHK